MSRAVTTIACPECGRSFLLSDAVQAEVDELLSARYHQKMAEVRVTAEVETRASVLEEVATSPRKSRCEIWL